MFVVAYTGDLPTVCVTPCNAATSISNFIFKCNETAATRLPLSSSLICVGPYVVPATTCGKPAAFSSSASRGVSALLARLNSRELQLTRRLSRALLRLVEISNTGGNKNWFYLALFFLSLCVLLTFLCIIIT